MGIYFANVLKEIIIFLLIFCTTICNGYILNGEEITSRPFVTSSEHHLNNDGDPGEEEDDTTWWEKILIVLLALFISAVLIGTVGCFIYYGRKWWKSIANRAAEDTYRQHMSMSRPVARSDIPPRRNEPSELNEFYNRRSSIQDGIIAERNARNNSNSSAINANTNMRRTPHLPTIASAPQRFYFGTDSVDEPPTYDAVIDEESGAEPMPAKIPTEASFDSTYESPPPYFTVQDNEYNPNSSS